MWVAIDDVFCARQMHEGFESKQDAIKHVSRHEDIKPVLKLTSACEYEATFPGGATRTAYVCKADRVPAI